MNNLHLDNNEDLKFEERQVSKRFNFKFYLQRFFNLVKIRVLMFLRYIEYDFEPIKCTNCHSKDINEVELDRIESIITEKKAVCKSCGKILGYWAYGSYEPWWF